MSPKDILDLQFQKRLSAIKSGAQIVDMSAISLKILTNDFEECYVRSLINKCEAPTDQLSILESIIKAFDQMHIYGYDFNEAQYDKQPPAFFDQFRLDLELGVKIGNDLDTLPTNPSDPKFEELCKSLIEQRELFQNLTVEMSKFSNQVKDGQAAYKKIISQSKEYEAKKHECEELLDKVNKLTVQLDEAQKMNTKLAKKSDDQVVEKIIRQYLNQSKKKSTAKKEHIKTIIDEMVSSAGIELSDELKALLDTFDNEIPPVIEKQEIYEKGSTKNENCKQIHTSALTFPLPEGTVVKPFVLGATPSTPYGLATFDDIDLPF